MTAKANGSIDGEDIDFEGGLTLLPNRAYVDYEGTEYEVDPTTFSFVNRRSNRPAAKAAQSRSTEVDRLPGSGRRARSSATSSTTSSNEGSADVGGTSTTKVSGDLNVSGRDRRGARS